MFLSYIIPVYNGAEYLPRCLDSILAQDISEKEYEIICVDDCSTDNSREVVSQYVSRHPNIRLICHNGNSRVATACNTGVDNAKGDYLWIIGQDDWIAEDSVKSLCGIKRKQDVILFNYQRTDDAGTPIDNNVIFSDVDSIAGVDLVREQFGDSFVHYLLGFEWRAVFRRAYVQSIGLRFPDGRNFEDSTYLFKAVMLSPAVSTLADTLYYYRTNPNSIMANLEVVKRGNLIYEFAFVCGNEVENVANELRNVDEHIAQVLKRKAIWYYNSFGIDLIRTSRKERDNFFMKLRENRLEVANKWHYLRFSSRLLLLPYGIGRCFASIGALLYYTKKRCCK